MKRPTIKEVEKEFEIAFTYGVLDREEVKQFYRKKIKEILKYLAEKPPVFKAYQYFPRKDNHVRCRLCGEKVYCTCIEGWRERDLKLSLKIKKIEGEQK